jgi:hypothetical protein
VTLTSNKHPERSSFPETGTLWDKAKQTEKTVTLPTPQINKIEKMTFEGQLIT